MDWIKLTVWAELNPFTLRTWDRIFFTNRRGWLLGGRLNTSSDTKHGENVTVVFFLTKNANCGHPTGSSVHCCWRSFPPSLQRDDALGIQFYSDEHRRNQGTNKKLEKTFLKLEKGPAQERWGDIADRKVLASSGTLSPALFSPLLSFSQFSWGFRKPSSRSLPWLWALSGSPNSVFLWKSPSVSYPFGI